MKRLAILLLVLLVSGPEAALSGQARPPLPAVVIEGLDALVGGHPEAAVRLWTATWTGPENVGKADQLTEGFESVIVVAGPIVGYDWLTTKAISDRVWHIYLIIRGENMPLFARFAVYKPRAEWIVTSINFHTDAEKVFPAVLLDLP